MRMNRSGNLFEGFSTVGLRMMGLTLCQGSNKPGYRKQAVEDDMAASDLFIRYWSPSSRITNACTVPSYRTRQLPSLANEFRI